MIHYFPSFPKAPKSASWLAKRAVARRFHGGLLGTVLCAVVGLASGAFADSTWTNPGTGAWEDAANWAGGVPGSNADGTINNGGTARLETGVSGNVLAVKLGGAVGGSSGHLEIAGGTITDYSGYIGHIIGSTGSASVTNGGSWINNTSFYVGNFGTGSLLINGGLVQNTYGHIGATSLGTGTVTVTSGTWMNAGPLIVSNSGTGALLVNGGYVQSASGTIGGRHGIATVSDGGSWVNSGTLFVGTTGTATLTVDGGFVQNTVGRIGSGSNSIGTATVNSGTWMNTSYFSVGYFGTGTLAINGGLVQNSSSWVGDEIGSRGAVTVTSGTWKNTGSLSVAESGTGSMTISGGLVQSDLSWIGNSFGSRGTVTVSGSGSWINSSDVYIGLGGVGTLTINGGLVRNDTASLGAASGTGTVTVTSGTWVNTENLIVGNSGRGSAVTIQAGGLVTTDGSATIGEGFVSSPTSGSGNRVLVTGEGSTWKVSNGLIVGQYGSNNLLTMRNGALVQIGNSLDDTLSFSTAGSSANNFLRVEEGYVALFGDRVETFEDLIADGRFQLWNGTAWIVSTDLTNFTIEYFTTNEAAEAFSGYSNLGGYTILTAVPEPATIVLAGLGVAGVLLRRRRLRRSSRLPDSPWLRSEHEVAQR